MERTKTEPKPVEAQVHTCKECGRPFTATGSPEICVFCRSQRRRDAKSAPAEPVTVATVETETGPEPVVEIEPQTDPLTIDPAPVEKIAPVDNATFDELGKLYLQAKIAAADAQLAFALAIRAGRLQDRKSSDVNEAVERAAAKMRRAVDHFADLGICYTKAVGSRVDAAAVEPGPDVKDLV